MVNLNDFSRSALADIVETYPWFSAARAALCRKDLEESGYDAADARFRDILIYLPQKSSVAQVIREGMNRDYSDADLAAAIRGMIKERKRTALVGGDYFSRDDYDGEKTVQDEGISRIAVIQNAPASKVSDSVSAKVGQASFDPDVPAAQGGVVTETLAEIYASQGYPEQAMEIYRKLSLVNPEKSAYFATLIDELKSNN